MRGGETHSSQAAATLRPSIKAEVKTPLACQRADTHRRTGVDTHPTCSTAQHSTHPPPTHTHTPTHTASATHHTSHTLLISASTKCPMVMRLGMAWGLTIRSGTMPSQVNGMSSCSTGVCVCGHSTAQHGSRHRSQHGSQHVSQPTGAVSSSQPPPRRQPSVHRWNLWQRQPSTFIPAAAPIKDCGCPLPQLSSYPRAKQARMQQPCLCVQGECEDECSPTCV